MSAIMIEICVNMVANETSMHLYSHTIIKTLTTTLPNPSRSTNEGIDVG